jgi:hypothetical protein
VRGAGSGPTNGQPAMTDQSGPRSALPARAALLASTTQVAVQKFAILVVNVGRQVCAEALGSRLFDGEEGQFQLGRREHVLVDAFRRGDLHEAGTWRDRRDFGQGIYCKSGGYLIERN